VALRGNVLLRNGDHVHHHRFAGGADAADLGLRGRGRAPVAGSGLKVSSADAQDAVNASEKAAIARMQRAPGRS